MNEDKIKKDLEEIETINIELDHRVKSLVANVVTKHSIDPKTLKIDVEPITLKLLNAHSAYIKHTQEEVAVLRDLVEHVKANYPLDHPLDSACRPTSQTFTIVGTACPLTRITTTAEVPPKKPTALKTDTPKPVTTLVYSRKPRKSKMLLIKLMIWMNMTLIVMNATLPKLLSWRFISLWFSCSC
ncbi:hypothetical protein Tco_1308255 [Tanacetum coccineum]